MDQSFGQGGLTTLPGADRFEAQDAPLVGAGGRITVAGLLRNASDRVFLARLESNGSVDASFGGGDLHTNVIAAGRRAATALTSMAAPSSRERPSARGGSPWSATCRRERPT